jgi:hypothetical protein
MARKFLGCFAIVIVLVIVGGIALAIWSDKATQIAFVPTADFVEQDPLDLNAYHDPEMWYSRPGMGAPRDPARWQPPVAEPDDGAEPVATPEPDEAGPAEEARPAFAVFFVHPTSYINRAAWNAPLGDAEADDRARLFIKGMASPFNGAAEIWAPKYRQATFGAFLTDESAATQAIDAAYRDVSQAFDFFLESIDPGMPIVLAGHSQGGAHIARLLAERIAGTPLQDRIAMAYPIGWPISVEHDLPALGLPACATAEQAGCVVSWVSFAEPAEPGLLLERYRSLPGTDGQPRGEDGILCVNPLTGTINGEADIAANLGTLVPDDDLTSGELVPQAVAARCSEQGLLLIGDPPELGPGVLPGHNYHVYDIPLFWRNLQLDVERRVRAWAASRT